ncbi:MAG: 1-(5-phosphoribosyl)-5-[(5-phosphoribosylamino)methylideneamino]imidazole-4-carboxamide isomerase [Candidatus Goldbacteria bacterium]|nr:1-(5-phosphoribosyl)-5-[(5-phosphoribosylamino)methylideneamino]imidazole-4-carboxamide isomerase [Candidatus Goldiibacteriota bacterium]
MQIIPAIDIRNGKCIRLIQGDVRDETVYSKEPAEVAKLWQIKGAKIIHIVDIDGAMTGHPKNMDLILKIIKSLKIKIQVGGGLRKEEHIKKYLRAGAGRIILSTLAVTNEKFLKEILKKYKEKIVVGIDVKNNKLAVRGWKNVTNVRLIDFIREIEDLGVKRIIYTDIQRDGVLKGPNTKGLLDVLKHTNMKVIVSGGISRLKNIESLMQIQKRFENLEGIIIGKALYTGKIDLKDAIKIAKQY